MLLRPPERRWPVVLGYVVFIVVVGVATIPAYLGVQWGWRAFVVRAASTLVLGVAAMHVRRVVVRRIERDRLSAFDDARAPVVTEPRIDQRLLELAGAIRAARRSRRDFDRMLWPRLAALGAPQPPPPRRFSRGPSLEELYALVDRIEHRQ